MRILTDCRVLVVLLRSWASAIETKSSYISFRTFSRGTNPLIAQSFSKLSFSQREVCLGNRVSRFRRSAGGGNSLFSLLMDTPILLRGVEEIADKYDLFILDQFGVLHNGVHPLPGVIETLEYLHAKNKLTVVLSNTSARSNTAQRRYKRMGLPEHYSAFITSGEAAWNYLNENYRGKKCTWVTWSSYPGDDYLSSLDIEIVDVAEADFLFFHGSQTVAAKNPEDAQPIPLQFDTGVPDEHFLKILKAASDRNLPAVCANPDFTAVQKDTLRYMPGTIKRLYESLGGEVTVFGKPSKEHFVMAIEEGAAAKGVDPVSLRAVHVGDSVHHDVAGANAAGISSLFVTSHGIHKEQLHPSKSTTTGVVAPAAAVTVVSNQSMSESHAEKTGAVGACSTVAGFDKSENMVSAVCDLCDAEGTGRPSYIIREFSIARQQSNLV